MLSFGLVVAVESGVCEDPGRVAIVVGGGVDRGDAEEWRGFEGDRREAHVKGMMRGAGRSLAWGSGAFGGVLQPYASRHR